MRGSFATPDDRQHRATGIPEPAGADNAKNDATEAVGDATAAGGDEAEKKI